MNYLLDSNAVIAFTNGRERLVQRIHQHAATDFGVSSLVIHELYFGAHRSSRPAANIARIDALQFEVVPFGRIDALHAADIRATLLTQGRPIGPYDMLIAGHSRARGLILITRNVREFSRVPGLRVENWED